MRATLLAILVVLFFSCTAQDCNKIPGRFSSYAEAIREVKKYAFKIKEKADVSESSWFASASYYSCDGQVGFFIYSTNKGNEYIHKEVPYGVWEGFRKASSKGSYYDHKIKGRYRFNL